MYCIIGRTAARFNSVRLVFAGLLFLAFQTCIAQSIESLESHLWTGVADIKVSGDYAFCSYRYGLVVLDVSVAAQMRQVAQLPCPGEGEGMTLRNDIVFLCMGSAGVSFIDVSSPESPVLIGQWDSPGYAFDIDVEGDFAYIGDWWHGLQIINISDLSNPFWVGGFPNQSFGSDVDVQNAIVALADDEAGTLLINVASPNAPQLLAHLTEPSSSDVCLQDTLLYVISARDGLWIFDISDPVHPQVASSLWRLSLTSCEIVGSIAYVASVYGFLDIFDVSDAYSPQVVTRWNHSLPQATMLGLSVRDGNVFIAFGNSTELVYTYPNCGVFAVDVEDVSNPIELGYFDSRGMNRKVKSAAGYVFVVKNNPYFCMFERDANGLGFVSQVDGQWIADDISVSGQYLFMTHLRGFFRGGLQVYDISAPEQPILVTDTGPLTYWYSSITVSDSLAYVYSLTELNIVDIRDVLAPQLISLTPVHIVGDRELQVRGSILYVAGLNGLQVFDATDLQNVDSVSTIPIECTDLIVNDNEAWVCTADSALYLFDISDPLNPVEVIHVPTLHSTTALTIQDEFIWIAEGEHGIEVLERTANDQFAQVAIWNSPGIATDLTTLDSLVVLADTYGVFELELDESSSVREVRGLASDFRVLQNYPNPFNSATRINFMLERAGRTELRVFDTLGREVVTLLDEVRQAGPQSVTWDAVGLASGVYFARLVQGEQSQTLKMVLLK